MARQQAAQIAVTAGGFDVEQQWPAFQVQLGAEDGLDAGLLSGPHELDRPVQIPGIGQRDRRTILSRRQPDDAFGRQRRVQE